MSDASKSVEIFLSYAEKDRELCLKLEKHLSLLQHEGLITLWNKRQVVAGTDLSKAVDQYLSTASVILLLVSSDFLASNYCSGTEVQRAMERHHAGEARVIPLLLRPCEWQSTLFGKLQALPSNGRPVTSWANRDKAFTDITQRLRAALQDGEHLTMSTPSIALPRIWNVPYPRNPFFTGQEEVLTHLSATFKASQTTAFSRPLAISGLGGIGKTQIAIEYAYQYRQDYQNILWMLADTRESLVSGYLAIAQLLKLPEKDQQGQQVVIQAVKTWLSTHGSWLLVLDNADDLAMVREFVPTVFDGHILLTTRASAMGRLAGRIEVKTMQEDVGALFLLRRASLIDPGAQLTDAPAPDIVTARELCKELGGLPLALDQAGAYIEEVQCGLVDYQQRYLTRRTLLLQRRGGLVTDHPKSVAATLSLSFEKVGQKSPLAADLLRFCAFLHPDAIPLELITEGASHLGPTLVPVVEDPVALDEATAVLGDYSLLRRNSKDRTMSIHRLVQAIVGDVMPAETIKQWRECVLRALQAVLPAVEYKNWLQWERVILHVQTCAQWIKQEGFHQPEAASVLHQAGWYLTERACYSEAQPLLERAYQISQHERGKTHMDTARYALTRAYLHRVQGQYEDAKPLLKLALSIHERELGPTHPDTAGCLNGLAGLYYGQGKYEQAEPLLKRAAAIYKQEMGPTHPDTAGSLHNLALVYQNRGKYEDAEPLLKDALSICEQELGATHPDTAVSLRNLANLYRVQGKYEDAELLLKRALSICEQELGVRHPNTAKTFNNLAELYHVQGKYEQAEALYKSALAIYEQEWGVRHPDKAKTFNNLAELYHVQGKYEQAVLLLKRALVIYEQQWGQEHPHTQNVRKNYAMLLDMMRSEER